LTTSILNKRKAKSLLTVESIGHFTPETMGCIKLARFGVHGESSGDFISLRRSADLHCSY